VKRSNNSQRPNLINFSDGTSGDFQRARRNSLTFLGYEKTQPAFSLINNKNTGWVSGLPIAAIITPLKYGCKIHHQWEAGAISD